MKKQSIDKLGLLYFPFIRKFIYSFNKIKYLTATCFFAFSVFTFICSLSVIAQTTFPTPDTVNKQNDDKGVGSPNSILILFDTSSSMKNSPKLNKVLLESLSQLVEQGHKESEYSIIGINTTPKILLDSSMDTETTQKVILKIKDQKLYGASAFYDACDMGITLLSRGKYSSKIAIVISDGIDTYSNITLDDLVSSIKNEKVTIYAVNVNPKEDKNSLRGKEALEKITSTTGGEVFNVMKIEDIESIFNNIKTKLQN